MIEMEKAKKTSKRLICLAIALMLLSMVVVSLVQTDFGKVTMKELMIESDSGITLSAYLFVPDGVSAENPAPAIVMSAGNYNNKEMTDANYVELARRGYVILALDQPNHGDSSSIEGSDFPAIFRGIYQGVLYVSRLSYVDNTRIGVTGHSAGGRSCNFAVAADNESETPLISAVLLNCADATYLDSDGNYSNIYGSRDVGMISAQYDEFFHYVYGEDKSIPEHEAPYFMNTNNAQSFLNFGADSENLETRSADTIYTQDVDGEEAIRVIYRPNIIHPWAHFSSSVESSVIEFFDAALESPNPIASSNQIWQWKEAFNFIGMIGMCLFIVSFAILMVYTPFFAEVRLADEVRPAKIGDKKGKLWFWGTLSASALFSSLIFLTTVSWGDSKIHLVRQPESFGIATWSVCCGLFTILCMFLYYKFYGKKNGVDLVEVGIKMPIKKLFKSILLAVIVAVVAYSWVFFADYFFNADFRLWTLAAKAFTAEKVGVAAFPYVWMFLVFYVAASISANCFNYNEIGGKWNSIIVSVFTAFPALIIPWIQYAYYFSTDKMLFFGSTIRYQMYVLWLFPMVLILIGATLISRAIYKKTKNPYIAGIVNAIIITIITCVNTRMYYM